MEKNNGFNEHDESNSNEADSSKKKSNQRGNERRRSDAEKKAKAEPLAHLILGEETITLFEKPKPEDKLKDKPNTKEGEEPNAEQELNEAVDAQVTRQIIEERLPAVEAEVKAAQTPTEAAVARADEDFLETARRRVEEDAGRLPIDEALEAAYEEAAARAAHEAVPTPLEAVPGEVTPLGGETVAPAPPAETTPFAEPGVPEAPVDPVVAAREAAVRAHEAPVVPISYDERLLPPSPAERTIEGAVSPSVAAPRAETAASSYHPPEVSRPNVAGAALFGYILGRRGGRKRAERKFKPIQAGLREKVRSLQAAITGKEAKIRDISRAYEQSQANVAANKHQPEVAPTMPLPTRAIERAPISAAPVRQEASRPIAEKPAPTPKQPEAFKTVAQNEQLAMPQLLQIAEQIKVDNISVRSMYEVGRFDNESLKRIVREYLGGNHNVQSVVAQEVERHDKTRFARFETLNQAPQLAGTAVGLAAIIQQSAIPQRQPGTLPQPVAMQAASVNPAHPQQPARSAKPRVSKAEKVVLSTSVVFIILAIVIMAIVLTQR